MKPRVVLDTNVVLAGLLSRRGASHVLLQALGGELFTLVVSVALFFEYEAVLKRPENLERTGLAADDVEQVLATVAHHAEPAEVFFLWRPLLADEADHMVVECAVAGEADFLVTLESRGFRPVEGLFRFKVIKPGELVKRWRRRPR